MHVDDRIAITYNLDIPSSLSLSLSVSGSLRYYRSPSVSVGLSRSLLLRASSGSPPVLTGFFQGGFLIRELISTSEALVHGSCTSTT